MPARIRTAFLAACLGAMAALGAGCEIAQVTVEQPEPRVVAEIYLRVTDGVSDAIAFLHQTPGERGVALLDADVRIRDLDGGQEARFSPAPLPACVEGLVPLELDAQCLVLSRVNSGLVRPGGRYVLTVDLGAGRGLEGTVTMPGNFRLTVPDPGVGRCRLPPGELLPMRWTRSVGARAYVPEAAVFGLDEALAPQGIEVPTDPVTLQGLSVSEEDTDIVFPSQFGIFNRFSSDGDVLVALQRGLPSAAVVQGEIVVSAQGRNSVNWNRGGNFNPSGSVRIPSLFGDGTGVVAGIVNRSFSFTTAPEPGVPNCFQPG